MLFVEKSSGSSHRLIKKRAWKEKKKINGAKHLKFNM